jgi:hypothetical protein
MGQAILDVPLPAELEAYLKKRVREGRERRARASLDHLLLEGLDSKRDLVTPEYLAELRRDAQKRIGRPRKRA